jgi:hypothetical protein
VKARCCHPELVSGSSGLFGSMINCVRQKRMSGKVKKDYQITKKKIGKSI